MSNEEIVVRIQAGEENLYGVLWEQVERLIAWKALRVAKSLDAGSGVEFDDLKNSGYLAMVAAVKTYNAESGAFASWLMYYLKSAFSAVTGIRTKAEKNDPLRGALSLSMLVGDSESDGSLFDIIPDPESTAALETVEAQLLFSQVREAMAEALTEIPEDQSKVIQQRYFESRTLADIANDLGITAYDASKLERNGLRSMRRPRIAEKLRPLYEDFDFYGGSGLSFFRSAGMSVQERYVILMERRANIEP